MSASSNGEWLTPPNKRRKRAPSSEPQPKLPWVWSGVNDVMQRHVNRVMDTQHVSTATSGTHGDDDRDVVEVPKGRLSETRLAKLREQARETDETDRMRRAFIESITWNKRARFYS